MIDSHSHIYSEEFDQDRDQVVTRALSAGVSHIILPNENAESLLRIRSMREQWPEVVSMTIGLHPEEVDERYRDLMAELREQLHNGPFVAIGEVGIDLYWEQKHREQQVETLDTMLHWCKELDVPFIIHCRNGLDECLWVLDNFGEPLPQGVFHSFTGSVSDLAAVRQRGDFYFGVNGIVTFKKSNVPELLPEIGLNRLLLETDSPYLTPIPKRGTRNESANIPLIAACIAAHLNVTIDEVARQTDKNAKELFKLRHHEVSCP